MGDLEKIALLIQSSVLWFGLAGLLLLCLIVGSRFQIYIVRDAWQQLRRLGVVGLAVVGLLLGVMTLHGGSKNTNGVPPRAGVTLRVTGTADTNTNELDRTGNTSQAITDEDISNGWRVVLMSTNALDGSVFAVPGDGLVWDEARARGARRGYWRLPLEGWRFSGANFGWTNGFVWTEGMFRPRVESRRDGFVLLDHSLSLAPAAFWSRYGLQASLCWCRTNVVGGLVGTFLGAAVDDDPSQIANAQFELFPSDGRLAFRYDLSRVRGGPFLVGPFENGTNRFVTVSSNMSEIVFQRVHPEDWDMDGLANAIDEDPRVAATNVGWNQSTTWAMQAFPSNAVEIATNGYPAWAALQAAEPNRHLIGLHVASPNGVWPICLNFGDKPVMCNGEETILFVLDDGAHYPFSFSTGVLEFVSLPGQRTGWEPCWSSGYPYERWIGPVVTHLDSPGSGWIGRTAEVEIDDSDLSHFFPSRSQTVTATVTNCHEDAYLGCEWRGGTGWTFADPHALSTTATWTGDDVWSTNGFSLVTSYRGWYTLTNFIPITVGTQVEPDTALTISCQEIFFLNDADFISGGTCSSNRHERIRPVVLKLTAPSGTAGNVTLVANGTAEPIVMTVSELDVTNRLEATNSIPLNITDPFARTGSANVLVSCPKLGRGTITATWTSTNGETRTATADFRCIEPLRKLVTTERTVDNRFVNPSRLVAGTNAVLMVGVNYGADSGEAFTANEVHWSIVSGPGRIISPTNGLAVTVEAMSTNGEVVVEARFNDDEVQPRFVLPIVRPRVIPVRAFIVDPPTSRRMEEWTNPEIYLMIDAANEIYSQVGIRFELLDMPSSVGTSNDWLVRKSDTKFDASGNVREVLSAQVENLVMGSHSNDCVRVYFVGNFTDTSALAFASEKGVVISRRASAFSLAHEFGHVLGLHDCFDYSRRESGIVYMRYAGAQADSALFLENVPKDWGSEKGRGFYEITDRRYRLLRQLLMYGYAGPTSLDIPDGKVLSLRENAISADQMKTSKVGANSILPTNQMIFSK